VRKAVRQRAMDSMRALLERMMFLSDVIKWPLCLVSDHVGYDCAKNYDIHTGFAMNCHNQCY
jgi:hypothetical protein